MVTCLTANSGDQMFLSSHFIDFIEVTPEMALKIAFAKQ